MALTRTRTFLCAALAAAISGCLDPGGMDMDPVNLFQRRLAERGAQERWADGGLGLLRPARGMGPPLIVRGVGNQAAHWRWDDELKKWVAPPAAPGEPNRPEVWLSLKDAVLRALAQNTDIRVVSFDPDISREEMIQAAAAFDVVAFGSYQHQRVHEQPRTFSSASESENRVLKAGVKELTPIGGTWSVYYAMARMWDNSGFSNPPTAYEPKIALEVAQPLLRDAWPEFNLAKLRIAQTNEKISQAEFRRRVEEIVTGPGGGIRKGGSPGVIAEYLSLWLAREELSIKRDLLQNARDMLRKVQARKDIDAAAVEIKQAEAAVKQREALVAVAVKALAEAQDSVRRLLADPQINLLSDLEINPVTAPSRTRVVLSEALELQTALEHNPLLEKARLAIALADINITVAKNQALPRLDLTAAASYQGLERHSEEAHETLADMHYLDYSLGLSLEYPLGNRERMSQLRQRRIERLKAVSQLQSVADDVARTVKERVREIELQYHVIELDHEVVEAVRVELQAMDDIEIIRGRLTPEFLRLKLDTQASLAEARIAELNAVADYNVAIWDLARVTGTILKQFGVEPLLPAATGAGSWPEFDERPAPTATTSSPSSAARKGRSAAGAPAVAAQ